MKVRRVVASSANKGGIGKTETQKRNYDLLPQHGRRVVAWDLDWATGSFAAYDSGIKTFDMRGKRSGASWLYDCYDDDIDDVLIDLPGGRLDDLLNTFGEGDAAALVKAVRDSGREFVAVVPIGVSVAETVTAQVPLHAFAGTDARIVVLKNGRFGDPSDFIIYDGIVNDGERRYGATRELAERVGAETVYLPGLAPRLSAQIDAERLRLIDATRERGLALLGRLGVARVQMHLAAVTEAWRGSSLDLDGDVPPRKDAK